MATIAGARSAAKRRKPRLFLTSGWYALALFGLAIVAFWPIYVTKLPFEAEFWVNVHTVGVVIWMLMLFTQPLLIRAGRRPLHRRIGKISYLLVPFIVVSSMLLAHHRAAAISEADFRAFGDSYYLPFIANLLFVICYGLAIRHRRDMFLHSRFMVATVLPLIDPVVARLLTFYSPVAPHEFVYPAIGFGITDAILLLLIWLDRHEPRGRRAFLTLLPIFLAGHLAWFTLAQTPAWLAAVGWFRDLPLT